MKTCQPQPKFVARSKGRAGMLSILLVHSLFLAAVLLADRTNGAELRAVRDQGISEPHLGGRKRQSAGGIDSERALANGEHGGGEFLPAWFSLARGSSIAWCCRPRARNG